MVPDVLNERNALIFNSQEVREIETTENLLNLIAVRTSNLASDCA